MFKTLYVILALFFVGSFFGCAPSPVIRVSGIDVYQHVWAKTTKELSRRASFALRCPTHLLRYHLLEKVRRYPVSVGVEGCGKRITYQRLVTAIEVFPWTVAVASSPRS
jgi:hypothetical protein